MKKTDFVLQLRVTVSAMLCRLKLPASVLAGLRENDVLEIAQPPDVAPMIELRVNGKLFARAAVFEREGCRFVRITELVSDYTEGGDQKWHLAKSETKPA